MEQPASNGHYLEEELQALLQQQGGLAVQLLRGTTDGFWYWDLEQPNHQWVSPAFWSALGIKNPGQLHPSLAWKQLAFPEDVETAFQWLVRHSYDPQTDYNQVIRYRHQDGSTVWMRCRGTVTAKKESKPSRIWGTFTNVTAAYVQTAEPEQGKHFLQDVLAGQSKNLLAETTALLNNTQKLAKIGSWKLQVETGIPTWTTGVFHIHELEYEQPYAIKVDQAINFYIPEDRPRIEKAIQAAAQHQQEFDLVCRLQTAKGRIRWVRVTGRPVVPPSGKVKEVVGFIMDITEQQKATAALSKRADMQQLIMMMASSFINLPLHRIPPAIDYALEQIGRFVQADRVYIFSIDRHEKTANNTYEWCAEGIGPQIENLQGLPLKFIPTILEQLEQGLSFHYSDIADIPADEERKLLEAQDIKSIIIVPMTEQEKCTGFVGFDAVSDYKSFTREEQQILQFFAQMLVNVQLRSSAEKRLQEKQEALEKLTVSVPGAIVQFERSPQTGRLSVSFASKGVSDIYPGLTPAWIKQHLRQASQLIEQKDQFRLRRALVKSAHHLVPFSEEYRVPMPDGSLLWHSVNSRPEKREDGTIVWYGIVQDITRQKEIEEIKSRARELEVKNKEMEQFTYVASHDLQEPLRTIHSFVDILGKRPGVKQDQEALRYIDFVQKGAVRMQQLIKGLLEYSELGSGDKQRGTIPIRPLIADVLQDLSSVIQQKKADVRVGPVPESITGYPLEIRLLFQNLISNALKFQKAGNPPKILIEGSTEADKWLFYVQDNGIGISSQHQARIFKIFKRLHHRSEYDGTGIGLSSCQKIVELHHGRLQVSSEEGEGSTFSFSIKRTT